MDRNPIINIVMERLEQVQKRGFEKTLSVDTAVVEKHEPTPYESGVFDFLRWVVNRIEHPIQRLANLCKKNGYVVMGKENDKLFIKVGSK